MICNRNVPLKISLCLAMIFSLTSIALAQSEPLSPEMKDAIWRAAHVTPHDRQMAWQELEFAAYAIYGMPTYHGGVEWGTGKEDPASFNPSDFDARQWMRIYKDAGMKLVIFMVKHLDGFCLWPTKTTDFSVSNCPYKNGKGDIVREVVDACREFDLKIGFYISPQDVHEPTYGTPAFDDFFVNQLTELLTDYGEITEVWFDGFYIGPPEKKQKYDWLRYYQLVRRLQPNAVMAVCGPDVRWVGNEKGRGRETEWSVVPARVANQDEVTKDFFELFAVIPQGRDSNLGSREKIKDAKQLIWYPAETNVSIRPNWFHRPSQNNQLKSVRQLVDLYYSSAGRNGLFLLGVPPAANGKIADGDAKRLHEFRQVLDAIFKVNLAEHAHASASAIRGNKPEFGPDKIADGDKNTYWTTDDWTDTAEIVFDLGKPKTFNLVMLQEYIRVGQRVEKFTLEAWDGQSWKSFANATTIGYKRLLRCDDITTDKVRLKITQSRVCPTLSNFGLFFEPPFDQVLGSAKAGPQTTNPDEANDSFSLVVMPDTQIYPQDQPDWRRSSRKEVFIQQTKWIADNVKKKNIKFVLHMGDIVNEQDKPYQWANANEAMSILDGVVPYCFVVGNHDMVLDETRDTTNFNNTFPYTRYENQPWYGGRLADDSYPPGDNYDNCYHFFDAGGAHYMIVSLECGPTDTMLKWADDVIASHPDKKVIVMTHSYMLGDDRRDASTYYIPSSPPANTGEQIWNKLIRKHANIFLVLCGHRENAPTHKGLLTSIGDHGNTVYQLLSGEWYDGWLRILTFLPSQNTILVKTYSPWKPQSPDQQLKQYDTSLPGYNTDPYHQFELTY